MKGLHTANLVHAAVFSSLKFMLCVICHCDFEGLFSRLLHDSHTVSTSFAWPSSSTSVFAILFFRLYLSCIFREEYDCLISVYTWRRAPYARISWGAIFCLQRHLLFLHFAKELIVCAQILSCSSSIRIHHISWQIKPLTGTTWELNCNYNEITAGLAWCLYSPFKCRAPFLIFGFWACLPTDLLVYLHCESLPSVWKADVWCCPVACSELGNGVALHQAAPAAGGTHSLKCFTSHLKLHTWHLSIFTCRVQSRGVAWTVAIRIYKMKLFFHELDWKLETVSLVT